MPIDYLVTGVISVLDIYSLIYQSKPSMRKSELKVADYVMANANDIIHFSISEFATAVGVSDPTIVRFCRALGYKGFQDFKINLAQNIVPEINAIHENVNANEEVPDIIKKVFEANSMAIKNTLSTLDFKVIDEVIKIISTSNKIIFHGLAGSAVVAMDAYHKFFRIGIHCEWFNDTHLAAMSASMLKEGDVFIAISHSGASKDIVEAVEIAKATAAITIAIVTHKKCPISYVADKTLYVASDEISYKLEPMSSRIAQLSVIDVLSTGVSLLYQENTISNIKKSRLALVKKKY